MTDFGSGLLGDWTVYSHATSTNWGSADVGIVGDSITARGVDQLTAALTTEFSATLAYDHWSSRPTTPAVDALLARDLWPSVLVMATGSNDVFQPAVMAAQIARVQAALPVTSHLLWVDVQVCRTGSVANPAPTAQRLADQRNSMWVNNQIWGSGVQVVPWSRWLANSSMGGRLTWYLEDGVHPYDGPGSGHGDGTAFWTEILMQSIRPLLAA